MKAAVCSAAGGIDFRHQAGYAFAMGTVHTFKRPPKNDQQFRGYRPQPPGSRSGMASRWMLRNWQKSLIVWLGLVLAATAFWSVGHFLI
jgi:hypothetical protein